MSDYAADVAREHEEGRAKVRNERTAQGKWADRIQAVLAQAEDAAKNGDEARCQELLDKASAWQLQFAIDDAMLARSGSNETEKIVYADFCQESNTPLIKAKRELIAGLADLYRGKAVMMGEFKRDDNGEIRYRTIRGQRKAMWNARAKVRVYAHESDLQFISQLYTSLILQMQTMMAADERRGRSVARQLLLRMGSARVRAVAGGQASSGAGGRHQHAGNRAGVAGPHGTRGRPRDR